jgi:hypothetical protein
VRAAALNHHDLWTLRGVGVDPDGLRRCSAPTPPGHRYGRAVVIHAVLARLARATTRRWPSTSTSSPAGRLGTISERVVVPRRNLVTKYCVLTYAGRPARPAHLTLPHALLPRGCGRAMSRSGRLAGGVFTAALLLAVASGIRTYVTSRSAEKGPRDGAGRHPGPSSRGAPSQRVDAVVERWSRHLGHSLRSLRGAGPSSSPAPPRGATRCRAQPDVLARAPVMGSSMGTVRELERVCLHGPVGRAAGRLEFPLERARASPGWRRRSSARSSSPARARRRPRRPSPGPGRVAETPTVRTRL